MAKLLNVGYGNVLVASRVVAIVTPSSAPMKRLKDEAREGGRLIDATQGRKTRSIIITDSDHIVLSALQPETVAARLASPDAAAELAEEKAEAEGDEAGPGDPRAPEGKAR